MPRKPRTSPRKLPTQGRAKGTVDAILEATARILVSEGFEHASTNRIAEMAGVSIGSLYQYFPNKEALVAALIDRHVAETLAVFDGRITSLIEQPLPIAVREMVHAIASAHAINPSLHAVLYEHIPSLGRVKRINEVLLHAEQRVRLYFERHRDEVRPELDLDLAAFFVVQMVDALVNAWLIQRATGGVEPRVADEITSMVLRYLAKEPSRAG